MDWMRRRDSVTRTEEATTFARIRWHLWDLIIGAIMLIGSVPVLVWNEGLAVRTALDMEEGIGAVRSVAADKVDPANEGKLVHLTGIATPNEVIRDPVFGVAVKAIRLKRVLEMFQWRETAEEREQGGKKTTTYRYNRVWSQRHIGSGGFQLRSEHRNPGALPHGGSRSFESDKVTLGAFRLTPALTRKITKTEWLQRSDIFRGENKHRPEVGEYRVRFEYVPRTPVTVVAKQSNGVLSPFVTRAGGEIDILVEGHQQAGALLTQTADRNEMYGWAFRFIGWMLMFFGYLRLCIFIGVLEDLPPVVKRAMAIAEGLTWLLLSFGISSAVIALSWLRHRPALAAGALLGALAMITFAFYRARRKNNSSLGGIRPPSATGGGAVTPSPSASSSQQPPSAA